MKIAFDVTAGGSLNGGEELVVVFDNKCLRERGAQSFLSQIAVNHGLKPGDGLIAYVLKTGQDRHLDDLKTAFNDDACLHSVDKQAEYKIGQSTPTPPNDPRISSQTHLTNIKYSPSYGWAMNATNGINRDVRIAVIDSGVDVYHPDVATWRAIPRAP